MRLLTTLIIASLMAIVTVSLQVNADVLTPIDVVIKTTEGEIHIEVYPDKAPHSSASFLKAVDTHHFDHDGAFYRVVTPENDFGSPQIEVIQGGIVDYTKSLPLIPHETTEQTKLLHRNGTVSLARGNGSTGSGSTFFICIGDQPSLDFGGKRYADEQGFSAFGTVTKGMDIVRRIQKMKTQAATADNPYAQQRLLNSVKILETYRK